MSIKTVGVLLLFALSSNVWATRARMLALGQDSQRGSHYIDDSRNIFRNAAFINRMTDYVVTEWGDSGTNVDLRAEGGIFSSYDSFSYGAYLGTDPGSNAKVARSSEISLGGQSLSSATGSANFLDHSDSFHLLLGGKTNLEWGVRFSYSNNEASKNKIDSETKSWGVGVGILYEGFEFSSNLILAEDFKRGKVSWDENTGMHFSLSYGVDNMKFFTEYEKSGGNFVGPIEANSTGNSKYTFTSALVGMGIVREFSTSSHLYSHVSMGRFKKENTAKHAPFSGKIIYKVMSVTVAFESEVNSWLTAQGSISQHLPFINDVKVVQGGLTYETDREQTAKVSAGATFHLGDVKIDGMIGTSPDKNSETTRVGVRYSF